MIAKQPIEQVQGVGHGRVPLTKTPHPVDCRIPRLVSHNAGIEAPRPGEDIHLSAEVGQSPRDARRARRDATQIRWVAL